MKRSRLLFAAGLASVAWALPCNNLCSGHGNCLLRVCYCWESWQGNNTTPTLHQGETAKRLATFCCLSRFCFILKSRGIIENILSMASCRCRLLGADVPQRRRVG